MIDGFLHGQREGCHKGEKGRQQEINKRKEGLSFRQIVAPGLVQRLENDQALSRQTA